MLKILRKYNTIILAFGGVVLMIAFVLPQLPQMFGGAAFSRTVADMGSKSIDAREYDKLSREFRAAVMVASPIMRQMPFSEDPELSLDTTDHWIMLRELATRNGLVGGVQDGAIAIDDFASQLSFGIEQFEQRQRQLLQAGFESARRAGFSEDQIFETLAVLRGIQRLMTTQTVYAALSTQEAHETFQDQAEQVVVDVRWFSGNANASASTSYEPEQLSAFFNEHKDYYPQDSPIGIGYLRPDAVKGEAIVLNRAAAERLVPIDDLTLSRFWTRNKDRFSGDYALDLPAVEAAYRSEHADELLAEATASLLSTRELELREFPVLDRYRDLPADFMASAETIEVYADAARTVFDLSVDESAALALIDIQEDTNDFFTAPNLAALPILGTSTYKVNERLSVPFDQLAMGILELGQSDNFAAQVGVFFGPLQTATGDLIFVRFTDARREGSPESYTAVEDAVRQDLARRDAFERIISSEQAILGEMRARGLSAHPSTGFRGVEVYDRMTVTQDSATFASGAQILALSNESFRIPILEAVELWDPAVPAVNYSITDRMLFIPVPESLGAAVVEIVDREPPTLAAFRTGFTSVRQTAEMESFEFLGNEYPLSPAALARELGYVKARRD